VHSLLTLLATEISRYEIGIKAKWNDGFVSSVLNPHQNGNKVWHVHLICCYSQLCAPQYDALLPHHLLLSKLQTPELTLIKVCLTTLAATLKLALNPKNSLHSWLCQCTRNGPTSQLCIHGVACITQLTVHHR